MYKLFGLKINSISSQKLLCRFTIKSASPERARGHVCITTPKHVCDELVRLNGTEFKGKYLFIENPKLRPKVTNPTTITFTSRSSFEPLSLRAIVQILTTILITVKKEVFMYNLRGQ